MVLDRLVNANLYQSLGERIVAAFEFLKRSETARLEPQGQGSKNSLRVSVRDGDEVFALIQRYRTGSPQEKFWEAHRRYIDVQCVLEGAEVMAHAPLAAMDVVDPYDAQLEYIKLKPRDPEFEPTRLRVEPGMFAIFWPEDAHMPSLTPHEGVREVKKIVVKVRV